MSAPPPAPPGWNDPPKFVPPPTGNLKINLNKRIAFPLSSSPSASSQSSGSQTHSLPSMPPSAPIPDLIQSTQNIVDSECEIVDLESKKSMILEVLNNEVDKIDGPTQASVKTKLNSLEEDWNQFDDDTKKHLIELVEFLKSNDPKGASIVHRKIVMKGITKPWLHAIRQIIMNVEVRNGPTEAAE